MMISPSCRALFGHVQKTGGSTIDNILAEALPDAQRPESLDRRHVRLRGILKRYPELSDYWIFGFVRNPWARMHSWYSMIERVGEAVAAGDEELARRVERNRLWRAVITDYADFEAFVLRGTEEIPTLRWPQISYLRTKDRSADFIGRQESFDEDMRAVLDRLGVEWPGDIPRENAATTRHDHRDAFTPAMRDRVAEVFAQDIALFGYEF